jgi:hypothetical protein
MRINLKEKVKNNLENRNGNLPSIYNKIKRNFNMRDAKKSLRRPKSKLNYSWNLKLNSY